MKLIVVEQGHHFLYLKNSHILLDFWLTAVRLIVMSKKNARKLCSRKDDRAMRLICECPESF